MILGARRETWGQGDASEWSHGSLRKCFHDMDRCLASIKFNRSRDRTNPFRYLYYPPAPSLVWDPGLRLGPTFGEMGSGMGFTGVFFLGNLGTQNPRTGRMPHTSNHTDLHEFQEGALPWRVFKAIRKRNRNYRFVCFVSVGIIKTTQFELLGLLPQLLPVPIFYLEMKPLGIGHPPSRVLR
jgi:hypothetical protein